MTIETVTLPKCQTCKKVITDPNDGYVIVGDIFTAALSPDGEPHDGLVGASFPTPSMDAAAILDRNGEDFKFSYDQIRKHCFCTTCLMEVLKIPHRAAGNMSEDQ